MKLFTAAQLKAWDQFTINDKYESSSELMEVAAEACYDYINELEPALSYTIFCGTGNNGGDGLCIARKLKEGGDEVAVYIAGDSENGSDDFKRNLDLILNTDVEVKFLSEKNDYFEIEDESLIIDCLFGTGLSRPIDGWRRKIIDSINFLQNRKISIDLPSGLMPDLLSEQPGTILRADLTLTIHVPKRAMLFPENTNFVGDFEVISIGLVREFERSEECDMLYYDELDAVLDFRLRRKNDYKNMNGHALILAGSKGKIGAASLTSFACLRAGAGLVTAIVPKCGNDILQTNVPEVITIEDDGLDCLSSANIDDKYNAVAIGPGIGEAPETALLLRRNLKKVKAPLVLDADALNIIAHKKLHARIPEGSVLTPHVGEFDRLFGEHEDSFGRFQTMKEKATEMKCIIVLKGAHTMIAFPDGTTSINSSGNPGMATAGSGDVLTGMITAFLAQGYAANVATRLGVFLHGVAGDIAAETRSETGMIARDIIESIPEALNELEAMKKMLKM